MSNKNKQDKRDYFSHQNAIYFPERQIESDVLGKMTPFVLGLMHDQIITITKSQISLNQLQFDGSRKNRCNEDAFYNMESIRRNFADAEAYVMAFKECEESVKEKFPLSEGCFKFLAEYFDGARGVISGIKSQFEKDEVNYDNDSDIYKALESLKTALDNINGIFTKLCESVEKLQA